MNRIKIHQFSPSVVKGDGISNGLFYLQKILNELGFISNIYAEDIEASLKKRVFSYRKINKKDKTQILLIHYSIYYNFSKWIDKLNLRKIIIYHNITPYHFFEKNSILYRLCKKGIEYLPSLANRVEGAIGVSPLNSKELLSYDFKNIETIPLLIDTQKIINAKWDRELFDNIVDDFNIIFIGRIAKNKAQHDLIEIANIYRKISNNFRLYIIGGTTEISYREELEELIYKYDLGNNVIITGKVSNEELYAYYRGANLFLCMSEHEGFGIPLIESMLFNVPVVAFDSSNIKDTLNGGGVLFDEKSHKHIASVIHLIRENKAFKRAIIQTQKEAKEAYTHDKIVNKLVKYLNSMGVELEYTPKEFKKKQITYQFEGPFDSSYSLAILNRYSALAFNQKYSDKVSLFATEGGGDYIANSDFLKDNPLIDKMHQKGKKAQNAEVVFRNLYPPRVSGMRGDLNILNSYGWEESSFPLEYVQNFNANLDGITVMSNYVKDVLQNSGVKVPIEVVGLGVEHILNHKPRLLKLETNKKFKFLHISSCFPRKGVDILLKAYTQTFTNQDDVTLIIKTFPNPHNTIEDDVKKITQNPNAPEIIIINKDLDNAHIAWLYQNSDVLVAPSRGEGFGLPMAEAMLFNLPVITTGFGGAVDFCDNKNSWLIDYSFQKAKTHLNLFNSYWVEPNLEDLKRLLKEQTILTKEQKENKTQKAYTLISQKFRWQDYREKTDNFIQKLKEQEVFKNTKVNLAWISSYNTKCGIATYSEFLLDEFNPYKYNTKIFANYTDTPLYKSKEQKVIRCWGDRQDKDNSHLIESIINHNSKYALVNFNFGFFSMSNLRQIIEELTQANIKVSIIFHSVADITIKGLEASLYEIKESLKKADKLLVHNIDDLNFFKNMGVYNTNLLPHGVTNRKKEIERSKDINTIASYGFMLEHKGILVLIEAFALLKREFPDLKLLLVNAIYPVNESQEYYMLCKKRVEELNLTKSVKLEVDFLEDNESFKLLDSANLLIMPYRKTKESASGAIRYAVSTLKPILCTPQPIFNDVDDIVHFTKGYSSQELANSIKELILDKDLLYSKIERQQSWIKEHDWKNIANRLQLFLR